jgi:hypothetical protein
MCEPDGRRPGRTLYKRKQKIHISPNGIGLRRCPRPTGPRAMWAERAPQRAEPRRPLSNQVLYIQIIIYIRRSAGRVLGDVFLGALPTLPLYVARATMARAFIVYSVEISFFQSSITKSSIRLKCFILLVTSDRFI